MIKHSDIEKAIGKRVLVSDMMESAIRKWDSAMNGEPLSEDSHGLTLGLANTVSERLANLAVMEMIFRAKGSPRAEWIDKVMNSSVVSPRKITCLSRAVGLGSGIWIPYQARDTVGVDFFPATNYFPVQENELGELCDVVFTDSAYEDKKVFHRLTRMHVLNGPEDYSSREREMIEELDVALPQSYPCIIVTNEAFESTDERQLGKRRNLDVRDEWADLQPISYLYGTDRLPLGYYVNPIANTVDPGSPVGMSIFNNAIPSMIQADKQYDRYDWEFTAGAMAIDTDENYLTMTPQARAAARRSESIFAKNGTMPEGRDRLFRGLQYNGADKDFYHVFAPTLRADQYRAGLQQYLKDVESHCNLAFGELSDPTAIEKTATEVMAGKQRMYQQVSLIQGSLEDTLRQLVEALNYWADILSVTNKNIPGKGEINLTFTWDDSIIITRNEEQQKWLEEIAAGIRSKAEYRAHFYGEDIETAQQAVDAITNENSEEILSDIE